MSTDLPMRPVDVMCAALTDIGRPDLGEAVVWFDDGGWFWLDEDIGDPADLELIERAVEIATQSEARL